MNVPAFYALEFLGEKFNKMSHEEKTKVIIHELMHIPETFGGGFKNHNVVTERNVEECYKVYTECAREGKKVDWFRIRKKGRR